MYESDIYQLVGKAYCDGLNQGMEKSASSVAALKSLFRAADKGGKFSTGLNGLSGIINKLGFNPNGSTFGQFYNALTNKDGLAGMARSALLGRAADMADM